MRFIRSLFSRSEPTFSPERATVMVLGMHRSGTSFLTGSLQEAGLELGKFSAWNPHNLKGNRENLDVVAFHDELLASRGFAWDNPPGEPLLWTEAEYARARELVAEYDGVARWGFKDPRTLLVLEGWQQLLPELRFVGIFRHPSAVAQSLAARGGMPTEQAFALWLAYNKRLLQLCRRLRFPLFCFDEDEAALHRKLDEVLVELGLTPPSAERFFSPELKHHQRAEEALPRELQKTYNELCRLAR